MSNWFPLPATNLRRTRLEIVLLSMRHWAAHSVGRLLHSNVCGGHYGEAGGLLLAGLLEVQLMSVWCWPCCCQEFAFLSYSFHMNIPWAQVIMRVAQLTPLLADNGATIWLNGKKVRRR